MAEPVVSTTEVMPPPASGDDSFADLLGTPNKGLIDDLTKLQRQKVGVETQLLDQTTQRAEEDRAYMRHMLAREGVAMEDVKPWDAKTERAKYRSDPIADFGSLASVFGIMASAFTKQPMVNALNASAGAMNAVRERNDQEYNLAYQAWKDNTELAIKRGNMMHQQYQDALSLFNTDVSLGEAKLKALAARFGDQQTLTMLEHGMAPQLWEMMAARAKATEGLTKALAATDEYSFRKKVFTQDSRSQSKDPRLQMEAWNEAMGVQTDVEKNLATKWWAEHPGASTEDFVRFWGNYQRSKYLGRSSSDERTMEALTETILGEHPDWNLGQVRIEAQRRLSEAKSPGSADERTINARARELMTKDESLSLADARIQATKELSGAKTKKTLAQEDLRVIEQKAAELKQEALDAGKVMSDTEAYRQARLFVRGGKLLNDETAHRMAEQWIRGDHTVFQNLGRGLQGSENVAKVWEEIGRISKERGITPEMLIKNAAEVKGLGAGEQTLYRRQANVIAAAEGFLQVAPTVTAISDKIDRTRFPTINSILLAAQRGTGDENVVRLAAALNGAINTYSRAINGGTGQGYVNDKEHARAILDIAYSKKQMRAAIDQLTIEVNAELVAPGQSKEVMYEMFTGAPPLQLKTQQSSSTTNPASGLTDDELKKKLGIK